MPPPTFLAAMLPTGTAAPKATAPATPETAPAAPAQPTRRTGTRIGRLGAAPIPGYCDRPVVVDGAPGVMDYTRACGRCPTCLARKGLGPMLMT